MLIGRTQAEPYILASCSPCWRWSACSCLFALAAGMLRVHRSGCGKPADQEPGRRRNRRDPGHRPRRTRHLRQCRLSRAGRGHRRRRRAAGRAGVRRRSRRLGGGLPAAQGGARGPPPAGGGAGRRIRGETGRWLRMRVRPLGESKREAKLTVWSIADVTRELERQENVFQELQHAIDYLDHAPAGFFSVDADGSISYLNATLAEWLEQDLAEVGSGGLKLRDIIAGEGARARHHAVGRARRGEDRDVRHRSQDQGRPHRSGAALSQGRVRRRRHAWAVAHAGHQSAPATTAAIRCARPKCASCASSRTRRWRSPPSTGRARSCARTRCLRGCSIPVLEGRGQPGGRSILAVVAERDRSGARSARSRSAADKQGEIAPVDAALEGTGERFARFLRHRGRGGRRPGGRHRLCARDHRAERTARTSSPSSRRWSWSASSPAASRTTSTTCSAPS